MDAFIKKTSDVPSDFVDDFFNIKGNTCTTKIDLDIAVKWLDARKDSLKRTLLENFENKYDYDIEKVITKNANGSGNHYEKITLTPDCFKEICMMSRTEKARQVRKYYISIEKLLSQYYETINEKINEELGMVKNNQKPIKYEKGGYIYGIRAQNIGNNKNNGNKILIKVGATEDIRKRLSNYNSGNANDVEILFIIKVNDVFRVENCIKNMIKNTQSNDLFVYTL